MAGLDPAIHALLGSAKNVDARDKPGHDDLFRRLYEIARSTEESYANRSVAHA